MEPAKGENDHSVIMDPSPHKLADFEQEENRLIPSAGTSVQPKPTAEHKPAWTPASYKEDENHACYQSCYGCMGGCCGFVSTWICCICCESPYRRVPEGFVAIVTKFGRVRAVFAPGLYYVNPWTEKIVLIDKREQLVDLRKQHVISKDNITSIIDAVVYFKIENAYASSYKINNIHRAIKELAMTSLRDVMGQITLQEALEDRDKVGDMIYELMTEICANWGVDLRRTLVQEVMFEEGLRRNLSTVATSMRLAESKVISAQADVRSAALMKNVSEILNTEASMQIRYLESISSISKSGNPKVVFFPSDFKQIGSSAMEGMSSGNRM